MSALRSLRPYAALFATAVLGGVVAVGAVALLGGLEGETTVVTETVASPSPSTNAVKGAMSVNEIYERAASGVVQITSTSGSAGSPAPQQALGSGFVLDKTATAGIVSALQRLITAPNRFTIDHVIQTDAPINHGSSGGPLLNARGQVIGVNTQIETGGVASGNVGIGFSVPSNTVKDVIAQIMRTGRVDHAYLGISGQAVNPVVADNYNLPVAQGVLVESVTSGSGAGKAGLQGGETQVVVAGETYVLGGDIIVSFAGKQTSSIEQLRDAIAARKPGDKVSLVIYRDAKKTGVTVTLGRQPPSPPPPPEAGGR